jgi:hypothetical protein
MTSTDANKTKQIVNYERGILTLNDGSKWKIPQLWKSSVCQWDAGDNVVVGSGFIQKHKITHLVRDESIEVEHIEESIEPKLIEE